jgi:hypothetical protein
MYVRMARFEGSVPQELIDRAESIKKDVEAVAVGGSSSILPVDLSRVARKVDVLLDRDGGKVAVLVYCDTAEDAAEVDRILDGVNPPRAAEGGSGRRVGADIYEVIATQTLQVQRAA